MILEELAGVFVHPRPFHKAHPRSSLLTYLLSALITRFLFCVVTEGIFISSRSRRKAYCSKVFWANQGYRPLCEFLRGLA